MSAADLLKMYNLEPLPSSNDPQIVEVDSASEISEESDQMKEPANNAAGSAEGQGLQFWDSSKLCMVRSKEGKKVLRQDVTEGEGGFLLAQFEGDANPVQTEVPNLVLHGAGNGAREPARRSQESCSQKSCSQESCSQEGCGQKNLQDCCPPMILKVPMMLTPDAAPNDAAPNDAAPSAAKSVSRGSPCL